MFAKTQGKELVVQVENKIGLLFELSKSLAEKGVTILGLSGAVSGDDCLIRLVTDDNLRAGEALAERGHPAYEESVILVELRHKSGMLKLITEALAMEGIDIHHVYATALQGQERCLLVLRTSDDDHALPRLNSVLWRPER